MNIKNILLAAAAVFALTFSASAQIPSYGPAKVGTVSNYVAASTATNYNAVIPVQSQRNVALQITQNNDAAGTANISYVLQSSVDNVTYQTGPFAVIIVPANGTTAVTTVTNFDTVGVGYLRLQYVTNAAASANLTNFSITYGIKTLSP